MQTAASIQGIGSICRRRECLMGVLIAALASFAPAEKSEHLIYTILPVALGFLVATAIADNFLEGFA